VIAKESSLGGTSGWTVWNGSAIKSCDSFGGGGTGGIGDPGHEEERSDRLPNCSVRDTTDWRLTLLSGVVIIRVDVTTDSGEVITPAVMYCIEGFVFASDRIALISSCVVGTMLEPMLR